MEQSTLLLTEIKEESALRPGVHADADGVIGRGAGGWRSCLRFVRLTANYLWGVRRRWAGRPFGQQAVYRLQ